MATANLALLLQLGATVPPNANVDEAKLLSAARGDVLLLAYLLEAVRVLPMLREGREQ